jgi:hypothetical protein
MEKEKHNLQKIQHFQYKENIQDYIVRMQAVNNPVCWSGMAW